MDVVEDASRLLQLPVDRPSTGVGLVEPIAKIVVVLFETFPVTASVAEGTPIMKPKAAGIRA